MYSAQELVVSQTRTLTTRIAAVIGREWPEQIHHDELQQPTRIADIERARSALLDTLGLAELI